MIYKKLKIKIRAFRYTRRSQERKTTAPIRAVEKYIKSIEKNEEHHRRR